MIVMLLLFKCSHLNAQGDSQLILEPGFIHTWMTGKMALQKDLVSILWPFS